MFVSGIVQSLFVISYIFTNANHFGSYTCYKVLAENSSDSHFLATLFLTDIDLLPVSEKKILIVCT